MSTLLLAAVGGAGWKAGVTLSANSFLAVELLRQQRQSGIVNTSSKSQHKVQGGLLLNIVITQSAAIFQLLSGENETLLIRGDTLFILDLGLHIVNSIARFDIKSDGLTREGFYEDLHSVFLMQQQLMQ